jgi:hypothetical protein
MIPVNITIGLKDDFVSFNVMIDGLCDISVGDNIRFSDECKIAVVSKTFVALDVNGFKSGDVILELSGIRCSDIYEFYSSLEFFKSRFSFAGGFNTNQAEPHQPYKLFRLYRRFMHEEDNIEFKVAAVNDRYLSLVRFYELFNIEYDSEHFTQLVLAEKVDLLELFIDFDGDSVLNFNDVNNRFDDLDDMFEMFRSL